METTQWRARVEFLRAIKSHAPYVLCAVDWRLSLSRDVLPLYRVLNLATLNSSRRDEWSRTLADLACSKEDIQQASRYLPDALHPTLRFETALCEWGKANNLTDVWLLSEALATLDQWQRFGVTDDWTYSSPAVEMYDMDEAFSFTFDPWDMKEDTWSSYKAKATSAFTAWLDDYKERTLELRRVEPKAFNKREPQHFVWLVEWQVNELTQDEIASKYQDEEGFAMSSVSEAITKTAALVGLTLRPERGRSSHL